MLQSVTLSKNGRYPHQVAAVSLFLFICYPSFQGACRVVAASSGKSYTARR